jgi:hypothetical protein
MEVDAGLDGLKGFFWSTERSHSFRATDAEQAKT